MSLTHTCYERLKTAIMNGHHQPGEPLKIHILKTHYDMGGSPIREALSRLVTTGFVTHEGKTGFKVAGVSESDKRDTYQTFYHIESLALTQAIALGDDAWEANIMSTLHALSKIENQPADSVDYETWQQRNNDFHRALISGCNSPTLLKFRDQAYLLMERYMRLNFSGDLNLNHAEHAELAECVLNRQTVKACGLTKHHVLGGFS